MKSTILLFVICLIGLNVCGQSATDSGNQYLLIIRYKSEMKMPAPDVLKSNGQHWGTFIEQLSKSGKLVNGIRPEKNGKTIYGTNRNVADKLFTGNGETVSSVFVIRAQDDKEAEIIAGKCPIFEIDGSVEIRKIQNMQ